MSEREQAWAEVSRVLDEVHTKHPSTTDSPEKEEEWIAKQVKEFRNKRRHPGPEELSGKLGTESQ